MTIVWEESALSESADIWLRADAAERQQITTASMQIERRLQFNPTGQGESRPHGRRILYALPLGVSFRFREASQTVLILRVWRIRPHSK